MKYFDQKYLAGLDHLYRINLVNSSSGFKSANLIATKNKEGISNVAVFSSVIHLGSNPPLLGFVTRPTTVPRNTYKNITPVFNNTFYSVFLSEWSKVLLSLSHGFSRRSLFHLRL